MTRVTNRPGTGLSSYMFNLRRLVASLSAGAVLMALAAGQASALAGEETQVVFEGVALGSEAALAVIESPEASRQGLEQALSSIDAVLVKRDGKPGNGPVHAREVLESLLADGPDGIEPKNPGLAKLAGAYAGLKKKVETGKPSWAGNGNGNGSGEDDRGNQGEDRDD